MENYGTPPERVTLLYREVGHTHVFTTSEWVGFHIGSSKLRVAFEKAIEALGEYATELYGCSATYVPEIPFEEFERHLHDPGIAPDELLTRSLVIATRKKTPELHY